MESFTGLCFCRSAAVCGELILWRSLVDQRTLSNSESRAESCHYVMVSEDCSDARQRCRLKVYRTADWLF